jgi:hypothetical protein
MNSSFSSASQLKRYGVPGQHFEEGEVCPLIGFLDDVVEIPHRLMIVKTEQQINSIFQFAFPLDFLDP